MAEPKAVALNRKNVVKAHRSANARIEFVFPQDPSRRTITAGDPSISVVRFGLWDGAFDADGNLRTGADDATNFIANDSRRFYLRVRDASIKDGFVDVEWFTTTRNASPLDKPEAPTITCLETAPGSGVFVSAALLLVVGKEDGDVEVHSGIPAGHPAVGAKQLGDRVAMRKRGQGDYRVRRATMYGDVAAQYESPGAGPVVEVAPLFTRGPEERKELAVQVYVMRAADKLVVPLGNSARIWDHLRILFEVFERIGVAAYTPVGPGPANGDEYHHAAVINSNKHVLRALAVDMPNGSNGQPIDPGTIHDDAKQSIGKAFPGKDRGATVRVFIAGALASKGTVPNGEAIPPWLAAQDADFAPALGAAFIHTRTFGDGAERRPYTIAHEVAHVLINVAQNNGHYASEDEPFHQKHNLMVTSTSPAEGVGASKRLWGGSSRMDQLTPIFRPSQYLATLST